MSPTMIFLMICTLVSNLLLPGQPAAGPAPTPDNRGSAPWAWSEPSPGAPLWTTWGAANYALADDGDSIWIGGTGSVVRWDKAQGSYRRYSAVDGLPHTKVLAVAVDSAGNRWFGGDRGLSQLDAGENWTHLGSDNSGLYSDQVEAIAVAGGDTLYLSHGLPGGSVSRLDSDGAWRWFPNRETAIQADYDIIVQARSSTALWTVAGDVIWAGSRTYDGERWQEHPLPSGRGEPTLMAVDSQGHVWTASGGLVYEWDGAIWQEHWVESAFYLSITALTSDAGGEIWIAFQWWPSPYGHSSTRIMLWGSDRDSDLGYARGPMVALLPTPEGVWGVGPGWLMLPDLTASVLADGPLFRDLDDALLSADGSIWLYSGLSGGYAWGVVQALDDRGTLVTEDDTWQVQLGDRGYHERVTAFERTAGDVWYASLDEGRLSWDHKVVRYHGGQRIEYPLGTEYEMVCDIFAWDQNHIWFAASKGNESGRVFSLDDGGTPVDTGDDIWQSYPIEGEVGRPSVAVDALGRLWVGQASGLYRHDGSSWQQVSDEGPVCDLAPAADGTLYAQLGVGGDGGCAEHSDSVLVVGADGSIEGTKSTRWLVEDELETVRTAQRRNSLWTVASDGAVWYIRNYDTGQELQRRSSSGLQTYPLQVESEAVRRLEVDARGRVWLVANSQLWRMEGPGPLRLYLPAAAR
mgnify:CR=1 FL=1